MRESAKKNRPEPVALSLMREDRYNCAGPAQGENIIDVGDDDRDGTHTYTDYVETASPRSARLLTTVPNWFGLTAGKLALLYGPRAAV